MAEDIQSAKIICRGGLDSTQNFIELSEIAPGSANNLINFEPSLFGGYRRISGYAPLNEDNVFVDPTNAEGRILGVSIFNNEIITARKQIGSATYKFYLGEAGSNWTASGSARTSTNVTKIRSDSFNFNGTDKITFVDGANTPIVYNGLTWTTLTGDQALAAPKFITVFKNHIFVSGDPTNPNIVAHSAPNDEAEWDAASGAGQIPVGFKVIQIRPFRDELYVFGQTKIKKITVSGTDFVLNDVTNEIGCIASDSVTEIGGDLLFLSQDGFRPISATDRIGDIELGSVSKQIQEELRKLILNGEMSKLDVVNIRSKSQVRFFFNNDTTDINSNPGIIGAIRSSPSASGVSWEWGKLRGIRTSCATSGYVDLKEIVIHGDIDGGIYRQELGRSFNGRNILGVYQTTYLDFGETQQRKTLRSINVFLRPEGNLVLNSALRFDWGNLDNISPSGYITESLGAATIYGEAVYAGGGTYNGVSTPIMVTNVEGSCFSVQVTFSTSGIEFPYTIQGLVFEFSVDGRK